MKKIIEKLWNGDITPAENFGVNDLEIRNLIRLKERNKEALDKLLDEQGKAVFEKFVDCEEEYSCLITTRAFSDGFCLASKLLTEALSEDE